MVEEWIVAVLVACVEAGEEIAEASEGAEVEWIEVVSEAAGVVLWIEGVGGAWDPQARWI